jgi:hypothetical protein
MTIYAGMDVSDKMTFRNYGDTIPISRPFRLCARCGRLSEGGPSLSGIPVYRRY